MAYDYAQTFLIDKSVVRGSPQVNISAVEIFFKTKPNIGTTDKPNKSGMREPGVQLLFCSCNIDGTPNLSNVLESSRLEYNEIAATGDASGASRFEFPTEVYCDTDKLYAIVVQFDGHEDFALWTNKKGDYIVGTSAISPGVTDPLVGSLYSSQDRLTADTDPSINGGQGKLPGSSQGGTNSSWIARTNEDLTFNVYVARYATTPSNSTSNSITTTTTTYLLPTSPYEFILFDRKLSQKETTAKKGELIFQNNPVYNKNGTPYTVSVFKNNTMITTACNTLDFTALYSVTANTSAYIVLVSENDDPGHPSGIYHKYDVRRVVSVESANTIIVDRFPSFSNSVAKFIVSPVGQVDFLDISRSFDARYNSPSWYYSDRHKQDLMVLKNSDANTSVRFVNSAVESVTITAGGSGYVNTDYLEIYSSTSGSVNAYANITTNSTGGITNVFITSMGYGMLAQPTFKAWANSTVQRTPSVAATLKFVEGPTLLSEINKFKLRDVEVINLEIDAVTPQLGVNNPSGTSYYLNHQLAYYKDQSGNYVVNDTATANKKLIKNFQKNSLNYTNTAILFSRSNEVMKTTVTTNTTIITIDGSSNNDFIDTCPDETTVFYHRNVINNDYTDENTPFGNALCKHISSRVTFKDGRLAEDMIVFLRAYRPVNTDIKIYARMYNSQDPEAFDDKDWTLLQCTSGADQYSSATDQNDLKEYTFTVPQYPNTAYLSPGTVYVDGNAQIVGSGTSFQSEVAGFSAGDLVKIYSPLFPENHFIAVVNNVVNSTVLYLTESAPANSSVNGYGMYMDKLAYPHQGFRNIQNENTFRYYNTSLHAFDGYDTFSIKTVLLSSSSVITPQVDDIRALGVSA